MVISRLKIRVTPFRALISLLITYLLSPLPLEVATNEYFIGTPLRDPLFGSSRGSGLGVVLNVWTGGISGNA